MLRFEWNQAKARSNLVKHGLSFAEACTVFEDDNARVFVDPVHSIHEERLLLLGSSSNGNICVVCFSEKRGDLVRVISARKANRQESLVYLKGV